MKDLEQKDMRSFSINMSIGNYVPEKTGIIVKTRFGIIDSKSEPAFSLKEKMKFSDKECWLSIKFHLDTDVDASLVVDKMKGCGLWKLMERYVEVYNKKNNNN